MPICWENWFMDIKSEMSNSDYFERLLWNVVITMWDANDFILLVRNLW